MLKALVIFFQLWCACSLFFRGLNFLQENRTADGVVMMVMSVLLAAATIYWDYQTRAKKT